MNGQTQFTKIVKRNGDVAEFRPEKIEQAIFKAMRAAGRPDRAAARRLAGEVIAELAAGGERIPHVERVQDAVAKAIYSEAIKPGTMVYPKGWQLDQHKGGGWSYLSSTEYDPFIVNNNFMDVLCDVRPWKGGEA